MHVAVYVGRLRPATKSPVVLDALIIGAGVAGLGSQTDIAPVLPVAGQKDFAWHPFRQPVWRDRCCIPSPFCNGTKAQILRLRPHTVCGGRCPQAASAD
jgi:hypothetical protein